MPGAAVGPAGVKLDFGPLFRRLAGDGIDPDLPDQEDCSVALVARRLGLSRTTVQRARREGISYYTADEWACRVGLHPSNIWLEWWAMPASTEDDQEDLCLSA
jgi:hypothetical protein